jgi:ABC-2 type transport system ATP-binding protein
MSQKSVIEVSKLSKKFGKFTAINNISFSIEEGETVGLLGPNGAGKTTTINMLLGIIKPTSGSIRIFSKDIQADRGEILEKTGFSSAYTSMQSRLSVRENLIIFGHYYGLKNSEGKIKKLLTEFSMDKLEDKLYGALSSGQKTRVNLIRGLMHDPKLLLLDEPTASLDPDIAERVREFLFTVRRKRVISMLYTSHNMEEVAQMCDRIIFLQNGQIVADDTPLELTKIIKESFLTVHFDASLEDIKEFAKDKGLSVKIPQPNIMTTKVLTEKVGEILTTLAGSGIRLVDVDITKPGLEDVFLKFARKDKK